MNFYPHHIGDYRSHTAHLSNEEDLAYRRLLEMYYDSEAPIPDETQWLARRLRVGTEVIATVLRDFFIRSDDGWRHPRCDREIAEYQALRERNRENGKKGGRPKSLKTKGNNPVGSGSVANWMPVETHCKGNQEPLTINQEPVISDADASGAVAAGPVPRTPKQEIWAIGRRVLRQGGMKESACGTFIGKLVKDYGEPIVLDAIRSAAFTQPASPVEYIKAACMRNSGQRQPINKQEALEARNRAVGDDWLREQEALDGQR